MHFLFRMVQERAVSEELAQEVFLRIYRSRTGYEPTARFTTWMFRIATHVALNWLRDEKMLPQAVPQARIMRFGYESQWLGREAIQQRLPLVVDQLLRSLMGCRKVHRIST